MKTKILLLLLFIILLNSCDNSNSPSVSNSDYTGTLVYDIAGADYELATYSFSSKKQTIIQNKSISPSWNQNGEILYSEAKGIWKIATILPNGTGKKIIYNSNHDDSKVARSPKSSKDGKYICFNFWFMDFGFGNDLYNGHATFIINSDGSSAVAVDSLFDGSWTPDGSLVLSATIDNLDGEKTFYKEGLYKLSSDRTKISEIGTGLTRPKHPAVSPDGSKVAFSMNGHIWTMNMDGSNLHQATTGNKTETHPCWSPDGKYIACISFGTFELNFYNALAIFPFSNSVIAELTNDSKYWIYDFDLKSNTDSGRIHPSTSISWK